MTLLLREVARFLGGTALWTGSLVLVAGAAAVPITYGLMRAFRWRLVGFAALSGGVLAAAAYRLDLAVWAPEVAGRPLPVVWILVGAGAGTWALLRRERADSST